MRKIKLEVLGLSYSQSQVGNYALILSVNGSDERIPIIIGGNEAQYIAIQLENLQIPRPLTHDLFFNLSKEYNFYLREAYIYKLEEGLFYSKLLFVQHGQERILESRTSDAIALALKFNSPIYASEEVVKKAGINISIIEDLQSEVSSESIDASKIRSFDKLSTNELHHILDEAIANEDYERATIIRDEINKRKR